MKRVLKIAGILLLAVLASSGQMEEPPADAAFLGELALDGSLRPVSGVLPMALAAAEAAASRLPSQRRTIKSSAGTSASARMKRISAFSWTAARSRAPGPETG